VVPVVYSFLDAAWERIFGKRKILRSIDEAVRTPRPGAS